MEKLFTLEQQQQNFELGKQLFLDGNYQEAEPLFQLVIESALQHNNYPLYVTAMIWISRLFVNTMQFDSLQRQLLLLNPLVPKYATEELAFYYKSLLAIFNSYYSIGDSVQEFENLFDELLPTHYHSLTFNTGTNLMFSYIKQNEINKGIVLYDRLETFIQNHKLPNKIMLYMYKMHGFALFFAQRDFEMCEKILCEVETNPNIIIISSFKTTYDISKALLHARNGQLNEAMTIFERTLENVHYLKSVHSLLKFWISTLEELNLKSEVITYQKLMIEILEQDYTTEVKRLRRDSIEHYSKQFYEAQIYIDQLTRVNNRNFFEGKLAKPYQVKNYTVAILDIDKFKFINDNYGHPVGDEAIKFIANHLLKWCPKHDIDIIRYGGDEFILLMPYDIEEMQPALQHLHETILTTPFTLQKKDIVIPISISMGVCYTQETFTTCRMLFEHADQAIYEAKRNRGTLVIKPFE